ncbi:MAG: hypothetical protein GF320_14210 [Armatimonadia bacterium]|nr:hypothetical protein [Armatimonadia bacterium]
MADRLLVRCLHHPKPENPKWVCSTPLAAVDLAAGSEAALRCRKCGRYTAVRASGAGAMNATLRCPSQDCGGIVNCPIGQVPTIRTCPECGLEFVAYVIDLLGRYRDLDTSMV